MAATSNATDRVEAMEDATEPTREPKGKRGLRILGHTYRRDELGTMAAIQITTGSSCLE
jgi:hypothetical protein